MFKMNEENMNILTEGVLIIGLPFISSNLKPGWIDDIFFSHASYRHTLNKLTALFPIISREK
jgi:hypothetical protein